MNKNLISQLVVSICAILLIATVTFAWFAISNTADAGFVAQVGDLESSFEFAAVENDTLVDSSGASTLDMKDVIPGQKFYFFMKVASKGSTNGLVSIMLNDIKSYYATGTGEEHIYDLNEDYNEKECEKIQYAFSYSITGAYWVPINTELDDKTLLQSDPLSIVVEKKVDADGNQNKDYWIEFDNVEKTKYFPTYDKDGDKDLGCVRFNKEENNADQDDYILLKNVEINGDNETDIEKTADDKSAFVVIFEIDFMSSAVLPSFVTPYPGFENANSNIYETQLFSISNISIITSKENE